MIALVCSKVVLVILSLDARVTYIRHFHASKVVLVIVSLDARVTYIRKLYTFITCSYERGQI
jgi:hypothetical protein